MSDQKDEKENKQEKEEVEEIKEVGGGHLLGLSLRPSQWTMDSNVSNGEEILEKYQSFLRLGQVIAFRKDSNKDSNKERWYFGRVEVIPKSDVSVKKYVTCHLIQHEPYKDKSSLRYISNADIRRLIKPIRILSERPLALVQPEK